MRPVPTSNNRIAVCGRSEQMRSQASSRTSSPFVWICTRPQGHIQATGRDAKRRKQYRYHKAWHEVRHETKYGRLTSFALALPPLRAKVDEHLSLPGLPRETAQKLVEQAHQVCPYSNATRGNVEVTLNLV